MHRSPRLRRSRQVVAGAALVVAASACKAPNQAAPDDDHAVANRVAPRAKPGSTATADGPRLCGLVSSAEVSRIVGATVGPPRLEGENILATCRYDSAPGFTNATIAFLVGEQASYLFDWHQKHDAGKAGVKPVTGLGVTAYRGGRGIFFLKGATLVTVSADGEDQERKLAEAVAPRL